MIPSRLSGPPNPPAIPEDRKLPGLLAALDPAAMEGRLRALLGAKGALTVQLLKHVAGKRAVISYGFEDGQRLIGKMYRKDRAQHQYRTLRVLCESLRGRTRTPQPLACWGDLGLLILEFMPGSPVPHWSELVGQETLMSRLGASLADLHSARLTVGAPATLANHVRRTCHPGLQELRRAVPHLGALLLDIERAMYAREETTEVEMRPCHGDFGPGQLLVTAEQVSVLDMDGLSHGDVALDVANFKVGLAVHAGAAAPGLIRCFIDSYLQGRPMDSLPGMPHYEAMAYLRRAMIQLRNRPSDWEEQVLKLAERAQRCL